MDIIEIVDPYTGEQAKYVKTENWLEGFYPPMVPTNPPPPIAMDDSKVDGVIYKKFGTYGYYKRAYSEALNVRWFGAKGDGMNDDTQAFKAALAVLDRFEKGILYCPPGTYLINEQLKIQKPFIGIKGESINSTVLQFSGSGISLSGYSNFSFGVVEDITLNGTAGLGVGITMQSSNFYFLNRFYIRDFDTGIQTDTAVLSKFSNFSIAGCRIGASFTNGSYATTVHNGNVNACKEVGIEEHASRVIIGMTDIEGIGIENGDHVFEGGVGIRTGTGTEIRDCHFERMEDVIGLNAPASANIFMENCFLGGCKNGIRQLQPQPSDEPYVITGTYVFKNLRFVDITGLEFDIPYTTVYQIEDCYSWVDGGTEAGVDINADPLAGVVKSLRWSLHGFDTVYKTGGGIKLVGVTGVEKDVLSAVTIEQSLSMGVIAANTTQQFTMAVPPAYNLPVVNPAVDGWTKMVNWNIANYDITPGLVFMVFVAPLGNEIRINVTNTTSTAITIPERIFRVKVG